jgi:L-malate glycosyltransferase
VSKKPINLLVISDYRAFHTVRPEAEIFIALAKNGINVNVMTYGESKYAEIFKASGIRVIDFHPRSKFKKQESDFIRSFIIDNKIDIIHLFNSQAITNGLRAVKGLDTKVVLYRGYTGNIRWYDPAMYLKYLNPRVDAIQCNSVGVSDLFKRQLFFDKKKAFTINKGHRLEWYENTKVADVRKEFNLPVDALVLINVANNRKMKGIPYLLKAMEMIPANLPIHLLLVGRDMDTPENVAILKSEATRNRVHFTGFREDALSLVAGSDVFVLSSLFGESITKAAIEAMALGIAPIITDIPGNVELVEHEKSGIIVPVKNSQAIQDAILRLYNNPAERKSFGIKAKERIASNLNTENTAKKVEEMYTILLQSN